VLLLAWARSVWAVFALFARLRSGRFDECFLHWDDASAIVQHDLHESTASDLWSGAGVFGLDRYSHIPWIVAAIRNPAHRSAKHCKFTDHRCNYRICDCKIAAQRMGHRAWISPRTPDRRTIVQDLQVSRLP